MSDATPSFVDSFNATVRAAGVLLSITRNSRLQQDAVERLLAFGVSVASEKAEAINQENEDYANLLLGCECVTLALVAELRMWLFLKDDKPDVAWDELITAQMASVDALRAHPKFAHLSENNKKLEAIEKLIFPPQEFLSAGMIVGKQECSICGLEYGDCDHLAGRPYMGRLCYILAKDLLLDHFSIVKCPANKRCRIHYSNEEGVRRNQMTWKIETKDDS